MIYEFYKKILRCLIKRETILIIKIILQKVPKYDNLTIYYFCSLYLNLVYFINFHLVLIFFFHFDINQAHIFGPVWFFQGGF